MKQGAIITGDIVESTKLDFGGRTRMLNSLQELSYLLSPICKCEIEIFRGDSFQISVSEGCEVLRIAIIIRAFLRSQKFDESDYIPDARIAIGVGTLEYQTRDIGKSDGQAYRNSGRLLDDMNRERLGIATPWREVNDELKISTAFADDIISSWTQRQSIVALKKLLTDETHVAISIALGISRQMVDKAIKASKIYLIQNYIHRFRQIYEEKTVKK